MKKIILFCSLLFCSLLFCSGLAWGAESPAVVVSIKPIHALVAGVMRGVAEPYLLVKGAGSPHGYALRPSEARALARADLIVWVGPQLESFLDKPLTTVGKNARQLQLVDALASELLPFREGGSWDAHVHEPDRDRSGARQRNPHFWLSPILAKQLVQKTAAALIEIDPLHREIYQQNSERLRQRLDTLHARLAAKLAPVKAIPYLVFHDAYQYFEAAYRLSAVGSITVNPERKPGARRILEMRQKIETLQARCVFSEPQFEPRLVATIIEGTGAKSGELDPIGAELEAGSESYFLLMNALADDLLAGLR